MLLMSAGCTDATLRGWMHIWKCRSNTEGDTITCFCNYSGFHIQEANNSLTRVLQAERVCCQTSPELLFPRSWTKATEAMGSGCISSWEKGRPPFVFHAPESHLLHGGKNYAAVLRAVQLHWASSLYLGFYHESYTSDSVSIPLVIAIAWYKGEQTVNFKGGNVVTSVN